MCIPKVIGITLIIISQSGIRNVLHNVFVFTLDNYILHTIGESMNTVHCKTIITPEKMFNSRIHNNYS